MRVRVMSKVYDCESKRCMRGTEEAVLISQIIKRHIENHVFALLTKLGVPLHNDEGSHYVDFVG